MMTDPIFLNRKQAIERLGVTPSTFKFMVSMRFITSCRKGTYHRDDVDKGGLALLAYEKEKQRYEEVKRQPIQAKAGTVVNQGHRPAYPKTSSILRLYEGGG